MNHRRFDDLARALGLAASRRQVFKAMLVGALGGALAGARRMASAGQGACPDGYADCLGDGQCTDLSMNPDHCGACGVVCPSGQCANFACVPLPGCPGGLTDCGGVCVDPATDPANCGFCGNVCPSVQCAGGACVPLPDCAAGLTDCGPYCADLLNDADNCGGCGVVCPSRQCVGGGCVPVLACAGGLVDCGEGVCADLATDPLNCGSCGNACPSGVCGGGVCAPVAEPTPTPAPASGADKWDLWTQGTRLRGAHILQRRVAPDVDDPAVMGDGPVGPPFSQDDLDRLAAQGANYVDISHPGLFAEEPPYDLDPDIQANLDGLLEMATQAGLFAVITFRTGPGRSEIGVDTDEPGTRPDRDDPNAAVWEDDDTQAAWQAMWRHAAERYRDNPIVVGYRLLAEPNPDEVVPDAGAPEEFYPALADTPADWNRLAQLLTDAVREVDAETPLLVDPMGRGVIAWLPYLQPTDDPLTVYTVNQFEPGRYVRPEAADSPALEYPGRFDPDLDDREGRFDRAWLEDLLAPAAEFAAEHGVPVAVGAFGVPRWQDGAARFLDDQMVLFEERGWNHGLWLWGPAPAEQAEAGYDIRLGPDPDNRTDIETSDLLAVVRDAWALNADRPPAP